jgi:hypothetical protein
MDKVSNILRKHHLKIAMIAAGAGLVCLGVGATLSSRAASAEQPLTFTAIDPDKVMLCMQRIPGPC